MKNAAKITSVNMQPQLKVADFQRQREPYRRSRFLRNVPLKAERNYRVGIYSGTFDPVHTGHIAFALQAAEAANLDMVCLMPERQPRGKDHVTHYAHRVAMIRRATRPYQQLIVLESEDKSFSIAHTWPRLTEEFAHCEIVYICGSDVLKHMGKWPHVEQLLSRAELCVGRRKQDSVREVQQALASLPVPPLRSTCIDSLAPTISSSTIRNALSEHRSVRGLLASVRDYAKREWLYIKQG